MIGQVQTSTHTRLYYLLLLATLSPAPNQNGLVADADTCIDVVTERYKPDADVVIGFISSSRLSSSQSSLCDLNEVRNNQISEAAKIIVDHPPSSVQLPNVTIGLEFYDDCGAPSLVTRAALGLSLRYAASQSECGNGQLRPGVIGPTLDTTVAAAASVLGAIQIPMVSAAAASVSSVEGKDGQDPPNVLRTLPSTSYQAKAIVDLVEYLGWNYISIVATRGQYGEGGASETRRLAEEKGICTSDVILLDASETDGFAYDDVVTTLSNFEAKGVVLWCSSSTNAGLLEAIERAQGDAYDLVLLSSDSAISNATVLESNPNAARGLIGIRPFDSSSTAAFTYLRQFSNGTFDNYYSIPAIDAVLAFEHALADIHQEKCAGSPGMCPEMAAVSGQEILAVLKTTTFPSLTGEDITFDSNGEPATFTLEIVQYKNDSNMGGSLYSIQQVGVWKPEGGLVLMGSFQHYTQNGLANSQPSSTCGNLCASCAPSNPSLITPSSNLMTPTQGSGPIPKNRGGHYMRIPGDLDIPSILSLSEPGWFGPDGLVCGHVRGNEVLSAEALVYALGKVNADPEVFPGVILGITVMDSCSQSVIATRQLTGVLGQTANLESSGPALGIVGPDTDDVTKKVVDEITAPAGLITISHGNNPSAQESSNFFQTTPSLDEQVRAIASLLAKLDWYYTGVIYSSSKYGTTGYEAFRVAAKEFGVCLGPAKEIPKNAMQPDFNVILTEMYSTKDLNVIVTFVEESDARRLLVTEHLYAFNRFSWVGTETWTNDPDLFQGFEKEALGTLVVVPTIGDLTDFQQYLSAVPVQDVSARNPWLTPALNSIFPCNNMTGQQQSGHDQSTGCVELGSDGLGTLITLGAYNADITHVINAFYALTYGADELRQNICSGQNQVVCDEFLQVVRSQDFYEAVANITFQTNGQEFVFINKAGPAEFTVQNFQQHGSDMQLHEVGVWTKGNLTLDFPIINLANPAVEGPQREPLRCSLCFDESNKEPSEIIDWELEGIWVTIILAVSAVCVFLIFCTICAFVLNHNHPVVTSASLSLSLWLLLGLAMMYCMNLAYFLHASTTICAIRRVGTALAYAVTYSALSVKSIRLNRLIRGKANESMSFTGSWSQSLLFCVFLSAQLFIAAAWLLLQRPNANAIPLVPVKRCEGQENLWSCDYTHIELVVSLAYVYALVLFTFFTSLGAVRYPYILNEGKFLFLSSLSSMAILVSWICVYVLADQNIAIPALCIGVTADASIILASMFLQKCGAIGKPVRKQISLDHKPEGDNRNSGVVNDRDETTNF